MFRIARLIQLRDDSQDTLFESDEPYGKRRPERDNHPVSACLSASNGFRKSHFVLS